jgi:hypothetical protein
MPHEPEPAARGELRAAPPFLSWAGFYWVVAGALLAEIALFIAVTLAYR